MNDDENFFSTKTNSAKCRREFCETSVPETGFGTSREDFHCSEKDLPAFTRRGISMKTPRLFDILKWDEDSNDRSTTGSRVIDNTKAKRKKRLQKNGENLKAGVIQACTKRLIVRLL